MPDQNKSSLGTDKPNWKEMLEALPPEKQEAYDAAMIEMVRRSSPSLIAQELASVQPMPDVDWSALGRAYAAICASHDRPPFLSTPRPSTPTEDAIERIKTLSPEDAALLDSPIGSYDAKIGY